MSFYFLVSLGFAIAGGRGLAYLVFPGIILTHFTYGIYFLKGLLVSRLPEEGEKEDGGR